jgi:Protein of unknown function (DUF3592)
MGKPNGTGRIVLGGIVYAAIVAPFIALGSVGIHDASDIAAAQRRVSQWPTVRGQLTAAAAPDWQPEVRYSYRLGNTKYESEQFALLRIRAGKYWARRCVDSLWRVQNAEGSIPVFYDPHDPTRAVIYVDADQVLVTTIVSCFSFAVALALVSPLLYGLWCKLMRKPASAVYAAQQ